MLDQQFILGEKYCRIIAVPGNKGGIFSIAFWREYAIYFDENCVLDNSVLVDVESEVFTSFQALSRCLGDPREEKLGTPKLSEKSMVGRSFVFLMSSLVYRLSVATVLAKRPLWKWEQDFGRENEFVPRNIALKNLIPWKIL